MQVFYISCFCCSSHLNIGRTKRTSADDLLFVGTSLTKPIAIILKITSKNLVTYNIATGMSVDITVAQHSFMLGELFA